MLDATIKAPRYYQVYTILRGWIFDGTYPPGSRIPPESELCLHFGVSKITSRKAIDILVQENLLIRIPGKGTYVAEDLGNAPNIGDMEQLIRKTSRLAKKSRVDNVSIREVVADTETCRDLKRPKGSKVREISFVRYIGDRPIGCRISYMPLDVPINIGVEDIKNNQMLTLLENSGIEISGADQLLGASLADTQKASLLNTTLGAPLVRIRLIVYDADGSPVERSTAYYLADRYEHHVYLARKTGKDANVIGQL